VKGSACRKDSQQLLIQESYEVSLAKFPYNNDENTQF
jgi:hypothetical protein